MTWRRERHPPAVTTEMTDIILVIAAVEIAAQAEDVIEADQGVPRERVIVETIETI